MNNNQEQEENSAIALEIQKKSAGKPIQAREAELIDITDKEEKKETERREAYIDPKTRSFLRKLLEDGEKGEITPAYSMSLGFVYPVTCETSSDKEAGAVSKDCLENLAKLGILNKSFYDSVSSCPNCQSTIITLHTRCPICRSHNVEKTSLTEHIPCGYIDQREKYKDNHCPKCGEPLIESQYRNMGRWYICHECGERFENPESDLICRNCKKKFGIKEALVTEVPKYSLNLEKRNEIRQNVAGLEDIRAILDGLGFSVEIPGAAVGQKSGMQHHFSLIARKQVNAAEIVVGLDYAVSESEVQSSPIILFVYKTSEVKVDIPIFIAVPKLDDSAKKIAQGHNILLIEGFAEQEEANKKTKTQIEERLRQITQNKKTTNQPSENKPETTSSFFSKIRVGKNKN